MAHSPTPGGSAFAGSTTTTTLPITHRSSSTAAGIYTPSAGSAFLHAARRRSPSPIPVQQQSLHSQQPPLSKRDKRRAQIEQRLKDIATSFSRDRDLHTRTQLNALSRDMAFISRAEVYANRPLDERPDDLVLAIASTNGMGTEADTKVALGQTAACFVNDVNNEMERRDALITEVDLRYRAEAEALTIEYDFALQVADAEHQALKELARQRVVSSVHVRRRAIQREKDQLDTADSTFLMNAHALTTLATPGSPSSGMTGARKTRYSRLRPDHDDGGGDNGAGSALNQAPGNNNGNNGGGNGNGISAGGASGAGLGLGSSIGAGSSKRKRKAPHNNGEPDESPGPSSRSAAYASLTSLMLWDSKRPEADFGGSNIPPASAPERFFTARELKVASTTAHATVAQMWTDKRLRKHLAGPRGTHVSALELAAADESDDDDAAVDYSTLVAPAMDRGGSHATRSTRLNQQAAEPLPTVTAENLEEMEDPRRIFGVAALEAAQVRSKVSGTKDVEAPLTGGMSAAKVAEDLAIIQGLMDSP